MSKKVLPIPQKKEEPVKEAPIIEPFLKKGHIFHSEIHIKYFVDFNVLKNLYKLYEQWFNTTFNNNNLEDEYLEVIGYLGKKYG